MEAITMMDSKKINAKDIITHRFTPQLLNKGLQMLSSGSDNSAKRAIVKIGEGEF